MESALLTTKLFIPPTRPGLVARPRLIERLQSALNSSLVLVSAPAGFGKTTLVSEWARWNQNQCRVGWVSLDEGDSDPVRFWDYFIASLKTIRPSAGETALTLLHSPQSYPTESVLTALINDLTNTQDDFAVVLDDYHLIKSEAIQIGIAFLLDHLPPKMHLVIATRTDPPLALAHFRGRGTMLEIVSDDLRFTLEEATALLKEMLSVNLAAELISALNDHTEGWAVGLKMAALSMLGQKDVESSVKSFTGSHRYIMDYLVEEVLKTQSDDVRSFLLKTSVLERLTAPLCDYIADRSDSQEMLEKLEQANVFLILLDESRKWYRYHHLFAELLRHQLEMKYGAKEVTALHQQASQWYEEHSLPDEAIHHALAARDWERAMRLIYFVSEARIKRGEWSTLFNWFRLIPDDMLRSNPRLYSHYASVLMSFGSSEAVETMLTYLERTAHDDTALQGEVALFRSILAHRKGDDTERLKSAEKALALLPPDNLAMRARAGMGLGMVKFDTGHLEEAWSALTEAYEMALLAGDYWVSASALAYLSGIVWLRGAFRRATELMQQTIELVGHSPAAAIPTSWLGLVQYELNDLEGAASNAKLANELNELGGQATNRIHNYFYLAQIHLVQGDIAAARALMEKSDQLLSHPHMSEEYRAVHMAYHILFALHQNNLEDAVSWGKRLSKHNCTPWVALWWVPARLMIAQGEKAAASVQLQDLYQRAVREDAQSLVIWIRVCQALAAEMTDEALSFLSDALVKGEPEGYIRTFVDEGKLLAPLLRKLLAKGFLPEYSSKLLNIIEAEERQRQTMRGEILATPQTTALLSGRELEILRLLAAGLSNRQISEKLFISLNTVKRHVHNISQKLDTQTRTRAIARARELKLL